VPADLEQQSGLAEWTIATEEVIVEGANPLRERAAELPDLDHTHPANNS